MTQSLRVMTILIQSDGSVCISAPGLSRVFETKFTMENYQQHAKMGMSETKTVSLHWFTGKPAEPKHDKTSNLIEKSTQ